MKETRTQLARLSLENARTAAALMLVIERHPNTPEARAAARRLPVLLARTVLNSKDPDLGRSFLDRYRGTPEATRVQAHLAALLYKKLPDRQMDLEAFIAEFTGTPHGERARGRLEALLAAEVAENLEARLLDQFRIRFPRSPRIKALDQAVKMARVDRRIARVDLKALEPIVSEDRRAARVVTWCKKQGRHCSMVRQLAARTFPWSPPESMQQLRRVAFDPDMGIAWRAMTTLGWISAPGAADHLLNIVGSQRLSAVWAAESALEGWLNRQTSKKRERWLSRALGRSYHPANKNEVQRFAFLCAVSGRRAEARRLLSGLMEADGRMLTASYLLARDEVRTGGAVSKTTLSRLLAAARARVKWLDSAFPAELHKDSLVPATLAERELFALKEVLDANLTGGRTAPPTGLTDLRRRAGTTLASWQVQLSRISPDFHPSRVFDLAARVGRHEKGRGAALKQIHSRRGAARREIAAAICRLFPELPCPTK